MGVGWAKTAPDTPVGSIRVLGRIAYLHLNAKLKESIAKGSRAFYCWQHESNRSPEENLVGTALCRAQAYSGVLLDELCQRDLRKAAAPARDCHCGLHARYPFVGPTACYVLRAEKSRKA